MNTTIDLTDASFPQAAPIRTASPSYQAFRILQIGNCALYHVNAGKMDALKARFRDYVDRPEESDRESPSQTDSLQSTPERRALRSLRATRAIHAGAARRIQIAAPIAGINTN